MPYEVEEPAFPIQEKEYRQVWKWKFLALHVLLPYQNDNGLMTSVPRCGKICLSRTLSSHQTLAWKQSCGHLLYPFSSV